VLGRTAFMKKKTFLSNDSNFRNSDILFQHNQVSFACPSDKNISEIKESMQYLWNYVDRGNLNYSGKKCGPEKFVHYKSHTDLNEKAIIRSKNNQTTVHCFLN
jgi:hypothetical protein